VPIATLLAFSGCLTVYQPMTSLQRPTAIDPREKNFEGTHLLIRCIPGDWADGSESQTLCQNMSTLFANQGAKVDIEVPGESLEGVDDEPIERRPKTQAPKTKPDLIMELTARRLANDNNPLNWIICYATLTLFPAITDVTFAQDVIVKDSDGFLLVRDSLQARFVRYFGIAVWAVNGLMDLIVRPKEEKMLGDAPKRDFSKDFHAHMSQLMLTARTREKVLHSFAADTYERVPGK
jgi:hypothetical protein